MKMTFLRYLCFGAVVIFLSLYFDIPTPLDSPHRRDTKKCNKFLKQFNEKLPLTINDFTTLVSISFSVSTSTTVVTNVLSLNSSKLMQEYKMSYDDLVLALPNATGITKSSVMQIACDPKKNFFFISNMRYDYIYEFDKGEVIWRFSFYEKDCT
ncbi:MAG: hypothetical protein VX343_02950 [Thermodesulfobacteriota bacterium]|nr:hypothetical protein [Thermodesulfobacteriota bacterium]